MNIFPLLKLHFWFNLRPEPLMSVNFWVLFFVFGLLLVIGSTLYFKKMKRLGRGLLRFGFFGLVWMFFISQRVPFLSARFWLIVWFVWFLVWGYFTWRYLYVTLPKKREGNKQKAEFQKYLP